MVWFFFNLICLISTTLDLPETKHKRTLMKRKIAECWKKKQLVVPISDPVYTIENQKSIRSQKGTELVHGFREKGAQFSIPSIDVLDFADNGSAHQTVTSHHTKL